MPARAQPSPAQPSVGSLDLTGNVRPAEIHRQCQARLSSKKGPLHLCAMGFDAVGGRPL